MHNLISHNQLAGWKQSFQRLNRTLDRSMEESDVINDYYDCLIECDDNQAVCKRICREVLKGQPVEQSKYDIIEGPSGLFFHEKNLADMEVFIRKFQ